MELKGLTNLITSFTNCPAGLSHLDTAPGFENDVFFLNHFQFMRERQAVLGGNLHATSNSLVHIRPPIYMKIFYWMQRGFSTIFSWQNITGKNEIHVFMVIVHVLTKSMA